MLEQHLYRSIDVNSWDALVRECQNLPLDEDGKEKKWIFRGQKRTHGDKFDFVTSLERAAQAFELGNKLSESETKLKREFRRRLHHYQIHLPDKEDTLELLALMQHYGAPTRLLDWTYSFYVATFFAVEEPGESYEVWALNANWFSVETVEHGTICQLKDDAEKKAKSENQDIPIARQQAVIDFLLKNPRAAVENVNPFVLNERLTIQQGVFLFPGDIDRGFEENLEADGYAARSSSNLYRFKIDTNARRKILQNLHRMNLNRATLFPGLDGFAKSLWTRLSSPETLG